MKRVDFDRFGDRKGNSVERYTQGVIVTLIVFLILLIYFLPGCSRAAEWSADDYGNVTCAVTKASEVPNSMPAGPLATVASGRRWFSILTPYNTIQVHLSSEMLKMDNGRGAAIALGEIDSFNQELKGLKTLLIEAEKKGLRYWGIGFELDPSVESPFFRIATDGDKSFAYRLVGKFSDERERAIAISALGEKSANKK